MTSFLISLEVLETFELSKFFAKQMSTSPKIRSNKDLHWWIVTISHWCPIRKTHLLQLIKQLHDNAKKEKLKLVPENFVSTLLTLKCLGHEIGFITFRPNQSKIAAIRIILSPFAKSELMSFLRWMNFYSKFFDKLHVEMKPPHNLIHDNVDISCLSELETLFQQFKTTTTKMVTLAVPNTNLPVFVTVAFRIVHN